MGDISSLKTIAEGLRSASASYGVFSDKITRMADNFDFEGIFKLVEELNARA
jgi:hypothetical protein